MKIRQLEYFLSIEKYKSFAVAAEENYISQSSLSKQIKALEKEIDLELFERNTRNVKITEAGVTFSFYAARMVSDYHKMTHALKKHHPSSHGFIKLISIPILTHYGLIDQIVEFQKQYPQIIIETSEQHTGEIQRAMKNDEADVYFLRPQQIQECDDYNMHLLVEDELALVVSAEHPLADRKEVSLLETADDYFLLFWYGTSTYHIFVNACRNAGFVPKTDPSYLSIDTILRMVADGKGVSLVAKKVAEYLLNPKLRVIKLNEKTELNTFVVAKKNNTNQALEKLLDYMKTE